MSPLHPRSTHHRGVVLARGFVLDASVLGTARAMQRAVGLLEPGARLFAFGEQRWLILFERDRRVRAEDAPGAPLVEQHATLLAAPLSKRELGQVVHDSRAQPLVMIEGGIASAYDVAKLAEIDPATWIDVGSLPILAVESLGEPPAAPEPVAKRAAPTIVETSEKARSVAATLAHLGARAGPEVEPRSWWQRLVDFVRSVTRSGLASMRPDGETAERRTLRTSAPATRTWIQRLQEAFARAVLTSRLGAMIGRKHGEYLAKLMNMFERGELDDALRHAIPLAKRPGSHGAARLSLPGPRDTLDLSFGARGGFDGGLGVGVELFEMMEALYRRALEALERKGRVKEAAFVLAELLDEPEEAVSFLERHGEHLLAAQLAEDRELDPALVVRQWLVAGDEAHALAYAHVHGAFREAIERLEHTNLVDQAQRFRVAWGKSLARAGEYAQAVAAVRKVESARDLLLHWIDLAIAGGEDAGAKMLIEKIALFPQSFEQCKSRVLSVLADRDPRRASERRALARAIERRATQPEIVALARPAARAVLRDRGASSNRETKSAFVTGIIAAAGDSALHADFPRLPTVSKATPLATLSSPLEISFDSNDVGAGRLYAGAALPGDQLLVAIGEAGVLLIGRDGERLHRFDVPAHDLIVADSGHHAIAVAPRGPLVRLSRIDILQHEHTEWVDARIDRAADSYDGAMWFVAIDESIVALDVQSERLRSLWKVDRLGGRVSDLARSSSSLSFLVAGVPEEVWRYHLPGMRLTHRQPRSEVSLHSAVSSGGGVLAAIDASDGRAPTVRYTDPSGGSARSLPAAGVVAGLGAGARWLLVQSYEGNGVSVHLYDVDALGLRARIHLEGSTSCFARMHRGGLLVGDDRGRLLHVDLDDGSVVSRLTMS